MNRRKFLARSLAATGALPLTSAPWTAFAADTPTLSSTPSSASISALTPASAPIAQKLLILVYLKGGNDAYNTFVPHNDARYKKLRPNIALQREGLIHVSDSHGFHPALAALIPAWEAKQVALVQGIGQQEITNQHYRDLEMQFTGASPDQYFDQGWLTRALLKNPQPASIPKSALDAIAFDDLDIREADPMGPFRGQKLRVVQMQHPSEWLANRTVIGTKHTSTPAAITSGAEKSFLQADIAPRNTNFPADAFGDALKSAVQLASLGMAPPVIHITLNALDGDQHNAFDTHWTQLKYHGAVLARLANGLAALREGMIEIGKWNDTLVATYDEFGRSPKENIDKGTHHGWGSAQFVMGGRVKGGLHGEALPVVDVFSIDGPPPVIDYRQLYTTIIESWWGGSAAGVFDRRFKTLDLLTT